MAKVNRTFSEDTMFATVEVTTTRTTWAALIDEAGGTIPSSYAAVAYRPASDIKVCKVDDNPTGSPVFPQDAHGGLFDNINGSRVLETVEAYHEGAPEAVVLIQVRIPVM